MSDKHKNYAWHFIAGDTLRDGAKAAKAGGIERYQGPLLMCKSGLHFSRNPFDAVGYAPGAILRLVEPRGKIIEPAGEDKGICTERRIIAVMDATELCQYFARQQAISVLHLWETEPPDVVLDFLMTGDESIGAAAWDAARAATSAATTSAAARYASRAAAWAATSDATWAATSAAARNEFTQLVYECFEDFL